LAPEGAFDRLGANEKGYRPMAKKKEVETTKSSSSEDRPAPGGLHPMAEFRQQMDRLFDDFFSGWPAFPPRMTRGLTTAGAEVRFDASEGDNVYEITAELPGMDDKDVGVTVDKGVLTIKGEKKSEREEKGKDFYLTERSFGSFRRSFPLPEEVNEDKISANFEKGVLRITLPKTAEGKSKARRISVSTK
jgi:HSP20 family protein